MGKNVYQESLKNPDVAIKEYADSLSKIKKLLSEIDEREKDLEELKKHSVCPNCGKALPPGMIFCPFCGVNLDEAIKKSEEEEKARRYCSKCGAVLEKGAKFCVRCGAPAETIDEQDNQAK